ncbi:MAG: deoxyhypusine synthase [Pseudomonadota bacterium]
MKSFLHTPVSPITLDENSDVQKLVEGMGKTAFQGRNIATATDIWRSMIKDETTIFLGLAGAMVPAGMRMLIASLIKNRLVDCIVSTGANLFHDCHETLGRLHWQGSPHIDDLDLFEKGIDRIYDVFALEKEFERTDNFVEKWVVELEQDRPYTTREFLYLLGEKLSKEGTEEGILTSAYKEGIPVYCPAIADSSIGIAIAMGKQAKTNSLQLDTITDILEITEIVSSSKSTGVIYIGGGVPKNFIQQAQVVARFLDNDRNDGHKYGIQISTDAPHWGGLSGCTFKEAKSWGKIASEALCVSVYSDATLAFPLIASATFSSSNEILKDRKSPSFKMGRKLEVL